MSFLLAKKQESSNQKKIRDLLRVKENKKCFDCPTKSPSFVNTSIQTFVCSKCSGLVREVGHRVKAISASKFTGSELLALKLGGNGIAQKIWLSNYSMSNVPEPEVEGDIRAFIIQKYSECKWLDRNLLKSHTELVRSNISKSFTEDGLPIIAKCRSKNSGFSGFPGFSRISSMPASDLSVMMNEDSEYENEKNEFYSTSMLPEYTVTIPPLPFSLPVVANGLTGSSNSHGRTSIESHHSIFSVTSTSLASVYSGHSGIQEGYVASNSSMSSSGRGSIDSRHASTNLACGEPMSLYNDGFRTSLDSIDSESRRSASGPVGSQEYGQKQEQSHLKRNAVNITNNIIQPELTQKLPSLQINVSKANQQFNQQQQLYHQQLKSSTLNLGNISMQQKPLPTFATVGQVPASPSVTPSVSKTISPLTTPQAATFASIISDLAGLKLEKTVHKATYTGGVLSPSTAVVSPLTPSSSSGVSQNKQKENNCILDPSFFSQFQVAAAVPVSKGSETQENDPYAALRSIIAPSLTSAVVEEATLVESKDLDQFSPDDDFEDDEWQEFCSSSSSMDESSDDSVEPTSIPVPSKETHTIDLFSDLDPQAMFKRF